MVCTEPIKFTYLYVKLPMSLSLARGFSQHWFGLLKFIKQQYLAPFVLLKLKFGEVGVLYPAKLKFRKVYRFTLSVCLFVHVS